jgi:hypothetical protein
MLVAVVCLAYLSSAIVWTIAAGIPELQDYPDWVYQGYLLSLKVRGTPEVTSFIGVLPYPVPNSLAQVVLAVLCFFVSPVIAAKLLLGSYILLAAYVVYRIARYWKQPVRLKLALVLTVFLVLNEAFLNGYINFQIATCIFLLYVVLTTERKERSPMFHIASSVTLFLTHFIIFGVFLLYFIGRYVVDTSAGTFWTLRFHSVRNISFPLAIGILPSLGLCAWYVLGRLVGPQQAVTWRWIETADKLVPPTLLGHIEYKVYTLLKLGPFQVFELPNGRAFIPSSHIVYLIGISINIVFALALVVYLRGFLLRPHTDRETSGRGIPHLQIISLGFLPVVLVLFAVSPQHFFNAVNVGERMLIPAVAVCLFLRPPEIRCVNVLAYATMACLPVYLQFFGHYRSPVPEQPSQSHVRFFTHRPYQFQTVVEFLERPNLQALPNIGFRTSLLYLLNDRGAESTVFRSQENDDTSASTIRSLPLRR